MSLSSYYQALITDFLNTDQDKILGELTANHHFALEISQRNAWISQIENLKEQLKDFKKGQIFFEFTIPRMGKRADVLLLIDSIVFVLEYKVGAKQYDRQAIDQALDYALDLKNFHEGSHHKTIIPILMATKAPQADEQISLYKDQVAKPLSSNGSDLLKIVSGVTSILYGNQASNFHAVGFSDQKQHEFGGDDWAESGYKPTPTIVEAAQALYRGHSVQEISRSDAGAQNLTVTSQCISEIIEHSKANKRKSICIVTGVPGAGKTLAGLNISTRKLEAGTEEHAVFLSGNGPLVDVLKEALARDKVMRSKEEGHAINKKDAAREVGSFIQNIHHFRDHYLKHNSAPNEHVVIFDEAQRAWNQAQAEKFMVQKRGAASFEMSEPEFLISVMDRRNDWCTVICLIGGGQEINTGEAGLIEWFHALQKRFQHWDVYHSGQLSNKNYNLGDDLNSKIQSLNAYEKPGLHLAVSIRSFRAEKLSDFVGAIIDGNYEQVRSLNSELTNFHMVLTRDINNARNWLRNHARGTERLGMLASSGAMRLKPEGIHVKSKIDPANWFLNGKEDIRSSYYLEDVATEFDIQGLELDWTGVCWDADFRMENGRWAFYNFKGTKWQTINDRFRKLYLANAYRVLLTRARQGMVIFVPHGDDQDHTRPRRYYDHTFEFLKRCGIECAD